MLTNSRFMTAATFSFSNDSCAITWHQWHVEYPTERKIGLFSRRALANASSPQGYQLTGLCACCRRYGDFSLASRFVCSEGAGVWSAEALLDVTNHVNARTTKRKRRVTVYDHTVINPNEVACRAVVPQLRDEGWSNRARKMTKVRMTNAEGMTKQR